MNSSRRTSVQINFFEQFVEFYVTVFTEMRTALLMKFFIVVSDCLENVKALSKSLQCFLVGTFSTQSSVECLQVHHPLLSTLLSSLVGFA